MTVWNNKALHIVKENHFTDSCCKFSFFVGTLLPAVAAKQGGLEWPHSLCPAEKAGGGY